MSSADKVWWELQVHSEMKMNPRCSVTQWLVSVFDSFSAVTNVHDCPIFTEGGGTTDATEEIKKWRKRRVSLCKQEAEDRPADVSVSPWEHLQSSASSFLHSLPFNPINGVMMAASEEGVLFPVPPEKPGGGTEEIKLLLVWVSAAWTLTKVVYDGAASFISIWSILWTPAVISAGVI